MNINFINVHSFLSKLGAEGAPTTYPLSPIIVEMMDGSVFAGDIEEHPSHYISPPWINPPHQELGNYKLFLRTPYGHRWTSSLREKRIPQNHTRPHIPFHIYIQSPSGKQNTAKNLRLFDNRRRLDPSKELVYLAMPDGSVYVGEFK